MTINTVLVPVAPSDRDRTGLFSALKIARLLGAHLEAVFVRPDPKDVYVYAGLDPEISERANREQRARVEANGIAAAEQAR